MYLNWPQWPTWDFIEEKRQYIKSINSFYFDIKRKYWHSCFMIVKIVLQKEHRPVIQRAGHRAQITGG